MIGAIASRNKSLAVILQFSPVIGGLDVDG